MEMSWKVWPFLMLLSMSAYSETHLRMNIPSNPDKLAECLKAMLRDPNLNFMINIRIRIEVESKRLKQKFKDTVDRFCASNDRVTVELSSDESTSYNIHGRVYFIDSLKSLNTLENFIKLQRRKDRDFTADNQNYFIILPESTPNQIIKRTLDMCWKNFIININILVQDEHKIVTIYTFFPFNEKRCSDSTPVIYNRFINGSLEWNKQTFPSKTRNLRQCPIRAILFTELPFILIKSRHLSGLDVAILGTLAADMNFSIEVIVSPEGRGVNYPNGTSTGGFKMLEDRMGDLLIGGTSAIKLRHELFAVTRAYFMSNVWIVIKRLAEYSPLEILLFPFDFSTWLIIFIFFSSKWIAGIFWKSLAAGVRPTLHLRLGPFLLTMLIIRSSYEGSIFKFLHTRPLKVPPNNLGETLEAGYKFVVWPTAFYYYESIPELKGKMIIKNASKTEVFELFEVLKGKYGLLVWLDILSQYNDDSSKYEKYHVVREPVMSVHPCIHLPKFSYLTRLLNSRLREMITHGRIIKIIEQVASINNFLKKKKVEKKPRTLSLRELMGAFQMFGVFIGVSVCVFAIEILSSYNQFLKDVMTFLN